VLYTPANMGDASNRLHRFAEAMSPSIQDALVAASGGSK